jgi:hypothetical protein
MCEFLKMAIALQSHPGDRLLKTLGIKTNDLNLIRVDAKRAQVSS